MDGEQDKPSGDPADTSYEVGYGKPPKASRFKPGRSGNPGGRPRGSRNRPMAAKRYDQLAQAILKVGNGTTMIRDGDKLVSMTTAEAILHRMRIDALKGRGPAQRELLRLLAEVEAVKQKERQMAFEAFTTYKFEALSELREHRRQGRPEPVLLPHPDDIILDPWSGSVALRGPFTPEEKEHFDWLKLVRTELTEEIAEQEEAAKVAPENKDQKRALARQRKLLADIEAILNAERPIGS